MLGFFLTEVTQNFKVWAEHETLNRHHLFAQSAQISYVVQNLERDVARRAQISEMTGPCERRAHARRPKRA